MPLISMLKTNKSSNLALKVLGANKVVGDGDKTDETIRNLSKSKKSKNAKSEILICTNIRDKKTYIFNFQC